MKNKTTILVGLLSLMAISICTVMIYLLMHQDSITFFEAKSTLLLEEQYKNDIKKINISTISENIYIKESDDEEIHVLLYGNEKEKVESKIEEDTLTISMKRNWFCMVCFSEAQAVLYVPKNKLIDFNVKAISGDVELMNFPTSSIDLKTTSGDIKIGGIENAKILSTSGEIQIGMAQKLDISTISGDIQINKIENKINAKTVSGDMNIQTFWGKEDSRIQSTSGDITLNEVKNIFIETKTISGDTSAFNNNFDASQKLLIETVSGDIKIK